MTGQGDSFDRETWCACHAVQLEDDNALIGDAVDDTLVHGAVACVRQRPEPAIPCQGEDPELWFSRDPIDKAEAKRLCVTCPVRMECLELALGYEQQANRTGLIGKPYGIWGGLSARERSSLLRTAGKAKAMT